MTERGVKYLIYLKPKRGTHSACHLQNNIMTYHTVIGKDLDIIHWTAQVLRNLPPDTSYCLITVGLQDTHTQSRVISSVDVTLYDKGVPQGTRKGLTVPLR